MKFLAISGSVRQASTNTALLEKLTETAPLGIAVEIFRGLQSLPIFSTDLENGNTPASAQTFIDQVDQSDGLIIASPEYARAISSGLKNSIDWLVSRDAIIDKPIVLIHASHRGDDMLASLRLVLHTVTQRFREDLFLKIPLMSKTPGEIADILGGVKIGPIRYRRFLLNLLTLLAKHPISQCLPLAQRGSKPLRLLARD